MVSMNKKKNISFKSYEKMAEYYFNYVDTKPFNAYYERPGTLKLLPDVKGKKILDAGCAAGWYSKWLLDNGVSEVVSIDFSPKMIGMTEKRLNGKGRVIKHDLNEPLDFLNRNSFDIVLSSLTLHYLKNWDPVMKEFNRILKKNGCLIFSCHHPFMDYTYFNRDNYFETALLEDEWDTNEGPVKVEFYRRPLKDIISPVTENGFQIDILDEPIPTEKFKKTNPVSYKNLLKKPQFLFVR